MASTDIGVLGVIILFLLGSAVLIPIVQSGFSQQSSSIEVQNYEQNAYDNVEEYSLSITGITSVFSNILKIVWIGVSGLPFWLDAFYTFLSVVAIIIFFKIIRG